MAETINIGDSYYKEVEVTYENDGEVEPVDLSIYDDNYVTVKKDRNTPDNEAYIFKMIPIKGDPLDGTLVLNLTPEETGLLPITSPDGIQSIMFFVQIGSSITGQIHEVSYFKAKTRAGGIQHVTEIDKSYDMGCITEMTGWIFDAGRICEQVTEVVDFDDIAGGMIVYNAGSITNNDVTIYDAGRITDQDTEFIDLGYVRECERDLSR